ncbi:hypothetical protein E2562_031453 [Oryza meyeriana var. granulata]|uniref:Uncharacterized protein n=1 Tax=Oryza meyeriana var. granulata TaxID=110450 RepID=A0A6G1C189_9ORYZ|nr:hypothetical protein E2562_031453 [Oryza meyeriana var. granulata]
MTPLKQAMLVARAQLTDRQLGRRLQVEAMDDIKQHPAKRSRCYLIDSACSSHWHSTEEFLVAPMALWAIANLWNCKDMLCLEVCGAPRLCRAAACVIGVADHAAPWLGIPSIPNLFKSLHLVYALGGDGAVSARAQHGVLQLAWIGPNTTQTVNTW